MTGIFNHPQSLKDAGLAQGEKRTCREAAIPPIPLRVAMWRLVRSAREHHAYDQRSGSA